MYIYHALINALSAHMIHINLKTVNMPNNHGSCQTIMGYANIQTFQAFSTPQRQLNKYNIFNCHRLTLVSMLFS